MYKIYLNPINPTIVKTKEEAIEILGSQGIQIQCPKSIADTYTIYLQSTTYFYERKIIGLTWTFEEALEIANRILNTWNSHDFDTYSI